MIFKTFDSKIDKWTSKIGVFGKSFNELGTAVNNAFKSVIDNLDNFDEDVGLWESLKNNLFSKKADKDWIKNSLGDIISKENIDSYIEQLDLETAKEKIVNIFNHETLVKQNKKSWQDYFGTLDDGESYIVDLIKNTDDLSKLTGEDLVKANQQARASTLAHNEAIKAQTFSAKAGKVALQTLATVGNMFVMWAISKGIELAVKGIDNLIFSAEHCKERVDELMSSYQSALDTANSNAKTVEDLAARYEKLSKGVNSLGETYGLTAEETKEYHDICNKIADMFPTLVQGYTNEGNAILSLKGNVEQLRNAYKAAQQEAYNLLIASGQDSDGNDIVKNWENLHNTDFFSKLFDLGAADVGGDISTQDAIKQLKALSEMSAETYRNIERITSSGPRKEIATLSDIEKEIGYGSYIYKALGVNGTVTDKDFEAVKKEAKALIQTYQAEINSALKNVQTLANAYLMTNEDYAKLDDQSKNAASIIVNSINEGIANGFKTKEDVGTYVIEIIDTIKNNTEIQEALIGLFTLDISNMPPDKAQALIDHYINFIARELEENPIKLKVRLGFGDVDTFASNYRSVMRAAAEKFAEKTPSAKESRVLYDAELDKLTKFAEENSIDTQEEIAFWNKCIEESETREEAMEKYLESPLTSDEPITFSSALSSESLSKFQSTIDSLKSSLTTLYNGDYSSTELISALTSINKAMSDIGKSESINWEELANLNDLDNVIDQITNEYVDSMLDSLDMAGTDFGNTIRNVIQEELKASRQLETYKSNVSDLQSAYSDLTDVIETYNGIGYITFDQLTSLLEMEPQYLSCLIDENGQLQLNQESMLALTNQRLNDAEAQAVQQAITELGQLTLQDEKTAVEENARAFSNAVNDLAAYNEELAGTIGEASIASSVIHDLNAAISGAESQGATDIQIGTVLDNLNTKLQLIRTTRLNLDKSLGGIVGGKSSSSTSTDSYKEQFDFFERRIKVLDNAANLLKTNLENVTGSFAKNQLLDQSSNILEERMRNYSDAARIYQQKAQEALSKLDSETQNKIINGSVSLDDYIGEDNKAVVEAMNDYKAWSDKVADCTQELASLKEELRQLELDKFNHIVQDFTDQFDLRDNAKNLIDKQIALFKEAGQQIGKAFYEEQIQQSQKQLTLLENEKAQLVNQMTSAIGSGRIQKGTDEWLEMVGALSSVDGSILDCKKSIEEFDNAIQDLHWETFDRVQDTFKDISDEINNLIGVIDGSDVATKDNQWTKEGLTQLGLYAQQYELATYQVSQYADEISRLNADYLQGKYSATEYADKLADLNSAQWDAVNAAQSAQDSIMKLNESRVNIVVTGIQEEIDAYKELMDSQIKALDAEKDLHEYQSSIAEQSKTIAKLEKQLAAMQNDTTASTVAKRKQLEEQLAEAKASLDETQYNHSVETQKEALNQQYQDYEDARNREIEALEETLTDREDMIASSMESVKQNTQLVADQLTEIANQHGITISNALILSWKSGENAIASYGEVLTQGTSVFIENIIGMENQLYQLQADADSTALSLASMFGTSADNLVAELNASYYAEANLLITTNALQNSLINTLQGGYDVSGIVNLLDSITKAAERTKKTIDEIPTIPEVPKAPTSSGMSSASTAGKIGTGIVGKEHMAKYASGARKITADQLAITNESGQELIYHAADGSILTPLRHGDKVFDNTAVERLWEIGQGILPVDITPVVKLPDLNTIKKSEGTVSMNYDHLIEINGDVNDTNHFIKQISTVAQQAIVNAVKTAEKTRKYGMF